MAATTATLIYPTPPPTVNKLDFNQRMRLMRSTRKLGQVLGTTPHLLEPTLPITLLPMGSKKFGNAKVLGHERTAFAQSASASASSLESCSSTSSTSSSSRRFASPNLLPETSSNSSDSKPNRSANAPRPLYIRLNVIPVSPTDSRFATSLPPTPTTTTKLVATSTSTSFPPTPCTPTFDQTDVRRKRMAKLTRHLGECIPPQLVSSPRKRRSMSVSGADVASQLAFSQHEPAVDYHPKPSAVYRQVSWIGEWNRDDMKDVQKQLRALKGR